MIPRIQEALLKKYLRKFSVTALIGARQVGKTTLARGLDQRRHYTSLDDFSTLAMIQENPLSFLDAHPRLTIDEIQKHPPLLVSIKTLVDQARKAGRFLLTGSANLEFIPKLSESLAGRISFVEMSPLTVFERLAAKGVPRLIILLDCDSPEKAWRNLQGIKPSREIRIEELILRGGYPEAWLEKDPTLRQAWFSGYVKSYLERDIRDMSRLHNLAQFQRFLSLCSLRSAQIFSRHDAAKDAGVAYTTADRYLDLLQLSFQCWFLPPYFKNLGKRLIKSPKIHWTDTGLAASLQGLNRWEDAERLGRSGALLETLLANEAKALLGVFAPQAKLFYFRTQAGAEIDLLIEHRGRLIPLEIKSSEKVSGSDFKSLENFLNDFPQESRWGAILYRGREILRFKPNLFAIPLDRILG